ncbi:copper chaperone PCu(A)C [Nonomuraea sp. SMC257]|uniref:Copper chaperone PCu(A)C n=1 Tax=Nonomuraea montanisoli TaxID=2741721 RepID=A0A7Y6IEU7_9ACTN|nr:copper chaperone PCu(A)C [Nonomuraea montanisoli]NUW36974.1 copper chaperone PCu(A)C [Nonomuraea montanisoli]
MFSRHVLVLAAALVTVSACGGQQAEQPARTVASASAAPAQANAPASGQAGALSITDPWVKTTKKGMTAAFGTLVNPTDSDITIVAGSTPLSSRVELHEVVDSGGKMIMRPKEGGIVVPARGTHELRPGGDHIMLMGVTEEVKPGVRVPFTLTVKGGSPLEFTAVGKDFAGGREDYQPGMKH